MPSRVTKVKGLSRCMWITCFADFVVLVCLVMIYLKSLKTQNLNSNPYRMNPSCISKIVTQFLIFTLLVCCFCFVLMCSRCLPFIFSPFLLTWFAPSFLLLASYAVEL